MQNGKLLILNTSVLTVGTVIMRSISVFFNIYLSNRIGSAGIGLLQLITTVYNLAVTFASGGVKLGATRLVSETNLGNKGKIRSVVFVCMKYALVFGMITAVMLFIFSGIISDKWIVDKRAATAIKILSLSLPAVAVSSVLSGYFTAKKTMTKYSIVQLIEQTFKIAVTVVSLSFFRSGDTEYACSAVAFGITVSEYISAIVSYSIFHSENRTRSEFDSSVLRKLIHISLPEFTGSGCRAILLTVEHILIPSGFRKSGYNTENAMSIYGYIHGMALPVILYPSAFISSLSSMLVPELSQIKLSDNTEKINAVCKISLRFAMIFSFGAAAFFFTFSDAVSLAVYKENSAVFYIKLLSVLVPVMYCDMITDGLLKGLDEQSASMRYNILDSAICVILVGILVPRYSVSGYIFVLFLSEIINFSLSINRLIKKVGLSINPINDFIKPFFCAAFSCLAVYMILITMFSRVNNSAVILAFSAAIYISLYLLSLNFTSSISKADREILRRLTKNRNYT